MTIHIAAAMCAAAVVSGCSLRPTADASASTVELRVNHLAYPANVSSRPTFSWKMSSARNGARQTAYRIAVREDAPDGAAVWESGIIGGQAGADPASVIYDAVAAAKARNADVLLCDTAGRLHNKKNLMEELRKIYRILEREYPDAYLETLVVLDGTTGQNALAQAKQFAEVANVSGIILTKLDGTAKGGIAVAIQSELDIPVKYIGVGESIDDLQKFDADAFVNALFDVDHKENPDA